SGLKRSGRRNFTHRWNGARPTGPGPVDLVQQSPIEPYDSDETNAPAGPTDAPDDDAAPRVGAVPGLPLAGGVETGESKEAFAPLPVTSALVRGESERLNAAASAKYLVEDYAGAVQPLRRVLNLNPDSAAAHNNLAIALWRGQRATEAELHCRRALALGADYVPAYKLMAEMLRQRNDAAGALAFYDRIV